MIADLVKKLKQYQPLSQFSRKRFRGCPAAHSQEVPAVMHDF
jgi:hypothetical protein